MEYKSYLGDGVYAAFDGYHVWLNTERNGRTHTIALEPDVIDALNKYVERLKEMYNRKKEETNIRLEDVKPGDILVADDGFDCMIPGPRVVKESDQQELYVECSQGKHLLDGAISDEGFLRGFSRPKDKKNA